MRSIGLLSSVSWSSSCWRECFSHFPLIPDAVENGVEAPPEQKNEGYGTQVCKRCSGMQKVFDGESHSFNASPGVHAIQRIPEFFGHGNHA